MQQNEKSNVGIVTLNGYYNYGNRLQNYALQEIIKELGFNVETIIIQGVPLRKYKNNMHRKHRLSIKAIYSKLFKRITKKVAYYMSKQLIREREKVFRCFSQKYLTETFYEYSSNNLKYLSNKYSFFVVGSDQVWKPVNKSKMPIYFLDFAEKTKRISYAPSFGVSKLPPECELDYKKWLLGMHKLSVREETGADIIRKLTGKNAPVLVDPTILLSKEKWLSISKEAKNKPKDKYLLTYFLGEVLNDYDKQIRRIAEENNLRIIHLADIKDHAAYPTGPREFIDYINSASVLCTDSFHGCVFSILMETPFIVYERIGAESMYSRIDTLLSKFQLESRKAQNIKTNDQVFEVDYSYIPSILQIERKKSLDYLKEALNIQQKGV